MIKGHRFAVRHLDYRLRDKYRFYCYGIAAQALAKGKTEAAIAQLELALRPPSSLGVDDFQFESAPRLHYYRGLALEQAGKQKLSRKAVAQAAQGWELLSSGRDSRNPENFYMTLALDKIGLGEDAARLRAVMQEFARNNLNDQHRHHRADAYYLLALVLKSEGDFPGAVELLEEAVLQRPDLLGPRFELRRDVLDPLPFN